MLRQPDLLPRSKSPTIPVADNHRLVQITDTLDWEELQQRAQQIRLAKLKNAAGQPPHLRATLGAMVLMAISVGVSAPISNPIGVVTRASNSSGTLSRCSFARIAFALDRLEIIPMYAALVLINFLRASSSYSPA